MEPTTTQMFSVAQARVEYRSIRVAFADAVHVSYGLLADAVTATSLLAASLATDSPRAMQ